MSSILCDKIDDLVGLINCIKIICETYGELALFPLNFENIDGTKKLNCQKLQVCKEQNKVGKDTKRLEYVEEELPVLTFMDKFKNLI